jgi:hypothetical protein
MSIPRYTLLDSAPKGRELRPGAACVQRGLLLTRALLADKRFSRLSKMLPAITRMGLAGLSQLIPEDKMREPFVCFKTHEQTMYPQ